MIKEGEKYLGVGIDGVRKILDYYNDHCFPLVPSNRRYRIQMGDEWCAAFTSVCAHQAGMMNYPFEVSCNFKMIRAKKAGMFFNDIDSVQLGDLILFDWNSTGIPNHIGIIAGIDNSVFTSLEGNRNGTVDYRRISKMSSLICGFFRVGDKVESEPLGVDIDAIAQSVIRGDYGNGESRKRLLGELYSVVQARVNQILRK